MRYSLSAILIIGVMACEGPEGPIGPQGEKGEQGIQGEQGDKGDTGEQGIQGEQGNKGDTGEQGIQGIQGEQGDKGDTGEQGIQGEQGDKGDTGEQGIQGEQGAPGAPGPRGQSSVTYVARFNTEDEIATWFKESHGTWKVEEGRLIMSGNKEFLMLVRPSTSFTPDIDISVDTEWLEGVDDSSYGILFRESSESTYGFGISADGFYLVTEWDSTGSSTGKLIDWTEHSTMNKRGKNTLRVVAKGSLLELYINGSKVNSATHVAPAEGNIVLYVSDLQEIAFDNLSIDEIAIQPLLKPVTGPY